MIKPLWWRLRGYRRVWSELISVTPMEFRHGITFQEALSADGVVAVDLYGGWSMVKATVVVYDAYNYGVRIYGKPQPWRGYAPTATYVGPTRERAA